MDSQQLERNIGVMAARAARKIEMVLGRVAIPGATEGDIIQLKRELLAEIKKLKDELDEIKAIVKKTAEVLYGRQ